MNEIQVDEQQLAADADAALFAAHAADLGGPLPPDGAPVIEPAQSWGPLVDGLGPLMRLVVFPQWEITPEEGGEFAAASTQTLDLLFPGGLEGKWAPVARLIAAGIAIGGSRYVMNGGKFPPLGPKRAVDKEGTDAGTDAGAGSVEGAALRATA